MRAAWLRWDAFERQQAHGLRDEQRIALGFGVQSRGELGGGDLRGGELDVPGHLIFTQPGERRATGDRLAGDLRDHCDERLPRDRLDVAHRREQQHVHRSQLAREEAKQQQGRRVGGVQIIEDQHERTFLRRPAEELGGRVKQPEPGSLGLGRDRSRQPWNQLVELGKDRRELSRSRTQLADEIVAIAGAQVRAQ